MTYETIISILLGFGISTSVGFRIFLPILAFVIVLVLFYIIFKLYKKIKPSKA